jgi:hypothetical protein
MKEVVAIVVVAILLVVAGYALLVNALLVL